MASEMENIDDVVVGQNMSLCAYVQMCMCVWCAIKSWENTILVSVAWEHVSEEVRFQLRPDARHMKNISGSDDAHKKS